jgi:hypothetical protein
MDVFSTDPPRGYISSAEQNENAASPRHSRKKGSAEDLLSLQFIVITRCDQ